MSTRSVIARRAGDGWEGVYHHSDGYPTGLGCYLFRLIRYKFQGDPKQALEFILAHDGGWSELFSDSVCYCHGDFAKRDKIRPGQKAGCFKGCECHPLEKGQYTKDPSCDPLGIEWVYVIDPEGHKMAVLSHGSDPIPGTVLVYDERDQPLYPKSQYYHVFAGCVDLDGPEPDWGALEEPFGYDHGAKVTWVDRHLPPVTAALRR